MPGLKGPKYVIPLSEITSRDFDRVGHKGVSQSKLYYSKLKVPDCFTVTTDAFDDFVLDADIVQIIAETLEDQADLRDNEKIAKKIYANILATNLRLEFLQQLDLEYSALKHHEKEMFLSFYPSFHSQDPELHNLLKPRETILVKNFEKITEVIKEIWTELFTTELIGRRFNDNFFDLPSIAIVIYRDLPYETTGRIILDKSKNDLSIQAQYGEPDKDYYYADEYNVDFRKNRLYEKKINLQTRMLVRRKNEIISIPVAKEWQKKQKVSEHILEELIFDSRRIEKALKKDLALNFGIHKGHIYYYNPYDNKFSEIVEAHKLAWNPDGQKDMQKMVVEAEFAEEIQKVLRVSPPYADKENKSSIKTAFLERLRGGLNAKGFLDEYGNYSEVFINVEASGLNSLGTMKRYSGLFLDLNYYSDFRKQNLSLSEYYDIFKRYTSELANIAFQNRDMPFIVKLSDFYVDKEKSEEYFELLCVQVLVIKKLLSEYTNSNVNVALPSLSSVEDIKFFYKLFSAIEINKVKTDNKVFLTISTPSFLYEINRFDFDKKHFLDGVIIDVNELMKKMYQRDKFTNRDYKLMYELLEKRFKGPKEEGVKLFFKINKDNKSLAKELLEYKPDGFIVDFVDL